MFGYGDSVPDAGGDDASARYLAVVNLGPQVSGRGGNKDLAHAPWPLVGTHSNSAARCSAEHNALIGSNGRS